MKYQYSHYCGGVFDHSNIPSGVARNSNHLFAPTGLMACAGTTVSMVSGRDTAGLADAARMHPMPFTQSFTRIGRVNTVVPALSIVGSLPG